nr:hypothetical protein Iba_chr08dCG12650 [Ipomoea batatas]
MPAFCQNQSLKFGKRFSSGIPSHNPGFAYSQELEFAEAKLVECQFLETWWKVKHRGDWCIQMVTGVTCFQRFKLIKKSQLRESMAIPIP